MISKNSSYRESWRYVMMVAVLAMVIVASAPHLRAQNPANKAGFTPTPTVTVMPRDFTGTYRTDNARGPGDDGGNCGSLKDEYGNGRLDCEYPVNKLEPYMNGRMRAWIAFFDEPLSPRWTCVGAGLQTGLQEGYLWQFSTRPDEVVQSWEQSS